MEEPLVSILIPFKNTAVFLEECLKSIVDQTYTKWEVLAVNDHSSDSSLTVVQEFTKSDSRIKLFQNSGTGIIDAMRTAYNSSKGSLITRMDSDDIMNPKKLEVMVTSLVKHGKGHLAVGLVSYFSENGISNGYQRYETWLNRLTTSGTNYSEIYKECVIPSPCWMAYREDLDYSGAFTFDRYPEDYDLAFRFYERNLKCIPCDKILHKWRDYNTRTSRTSEHYAQNYFLDIKVHYFLKLDYINTRPLVIWGAGSKGKNTAKILVDKQIDFHWICDNSKKIGKSIYGKEMKHFKVLEHLENSQTIITVANAEEQQIITSYLNNLKQSPMTDYFLFC